jgi:murein L,D-transpeptidase YafK
MNKKLFCSLLIGFVLTLLAAPTQAQDDVATFRNFQFSFPRVSQSWSKWNDSLKNMFVSKGLAYPPKDIYLRAFKSNNEMELWARNNDSAKYELVKLYHVCALSGGMGPKRFEGDRQVPEGMYFIEEFNPKSDYFLSMLLNYPNYSDMIMGDKRKPGGDVYIHGGCVTIGCLPMTDPVIQELYSLCLSARMNGQVYIPVHIYPVRFDRRGLNYLGRNFAFDTEKQRFWVNLKAGYDYFERWRKLMPVIYTPDGRYVF